MERSTYGKLTELDLNSIGQEWAEYCEQMDFYFCANEITEAKQRKSILLASVGNDTFKLIRNLIGKEQLKAETTTLDVIVQRVKNHLAPRPNYIFARSDFFDCVRKPGQSVAEFIVVLRKLSEHCKFINLDEMLRDKLVNGLKDMQTQRRFFEISEEKLTLEKAEQIALAVEKANKNAKLLNQESVTESQGASGIASEERIHRSEKAESLPQAQRQTNSTRIPKAKAKISSATGVAAHISCATVHASSRSAVIAAA